MFWDWLEGGLPPARLFSRRTGQEIKEEVIRLDDETGDYWVTVRLGNKVRINRDGTLKLIHRVCPGGIRVEWQPQHRQTSR